MLLGIQQFTFSKNTELQLVQPKWDSYYCKSYSDKLLTA